MRALPTVPGSLQATAGTRAGASVACSSLAALAVRTTEVGEARFLPRVRERLEPVVLSLVPA